MSMCNSPVGDDGSRCHRGEDDMGCEASIDRNSGPSLIEHILGSVKFCGEGEPWAGTRAARSVQASNARLNGWVQMQHQHNSVVRRWVEVAPAELVPGPRTSAQRSAV